MKGQNEQAYKQVENKFNEYVTNIEKSSPENAAFLSGLKEHIFKDYEKAQSEWRSFLIKNPNYYLPESLLDELFIAGSNPQGEVPTAYQNEEGLDWFGKKIVGYMGAPTRAQLARERLKRAVKREAVRIASEDRKAEEWVSSEKEVFEKWCKKAKKEGSSPEAKKYKESEEFKDKVDDEYIKKTKSEKKIAALSEFVKTQIFVTPKDDPVFKELVKILNEITDEYKEKDDKQKKKFPEEKARKTVLEVFSKDFPDKKKEYLSWKRQREYKRDVVSTDWLQGDLEGTWRALDAIERLAPEEYETGARTVIPMSRIPSESASSDEPNQPIQPPRQQKRQRRPITSGINRLNNFLNPRLGSSQAAHGLERAGAEVIKKGAMIITKSPWFWVIVGAIVLILLIIMIIVSIVSGGGEEGGITQLSLNKIVSPETVPNRSENLSSDATFTISASYSGNGTVTVLDQIPENAEFVSAGPSGADYELLDINEQPTSNPEEVTTVKWTIPFNNGGASTSETVQINVSSSTFNNLAYGYPAPENPNPVLSYGYYQTWLTMWNSYMSAHAVTAGQSLGIDPAMIGAWPLIEQISDTFTDNCNDGKNGGDYLANTPCMYTSWQVGYGVRIMEQLDKLQTAIQVMQPGKSLAEIGNGVIQASKTRDPKDPITYPAVFPADKSLSDIIDGARKGDRLSRQLLGILVKDDAIGTYLVGAVMKGYMGYGSKMASEFQWPKGNLYYAPQKISNHFDAAYKAGVSSGSANAVTKQVTLTLKPKMGTENTYIINQAFAQASGSLDKTASTATITLDPGHPSDISMGAPGETELNWQVANKIKPILEGKGYKVKMTKSSLNENVSNKKRAEIANSYNSSLFFRIHADGAVSSERGYFMMTPNVTSATTGLPSLESQQKGLEAARAVISALDAANLGIPKSSNPFRADSSGGNAGEVCKNLLEGSCYSKVPVTLIEMGNLGNSSDKNWLASSSNQDLLAQAISNGISNFISTQTNTSVEPVVRSTESSEFNQSFAFAESNCAVLTVGKPTQKVTLPDKCKQSQFSGSTEHGLRAVELARSQIGKPYILGTCHGNLSKSPPPNGCSTYDCSGLARWAWYWATDGKVNYLWDTATNWNQGVGDVQRFTTNDFSQLIPGDLVYFGDVVSDADHVAIYAGNGMIVHARGRAYGVVETRLSDRRDAIGFLRPMVK